MCQNNFCASNRIVSVHGKVDDRFNYNQPNLEINYNGYVPKDLGIGSGDYISFSFCLDCGQIQGQCFPRPQTRQEQEAEIDEEFGDFGEIEDDGPEYSSYVQQKMAGYLD